MLDQVSTAMRRVALSTDAPLEFYTMIARDPGPSALDLIFSGHFEDLKRVQFLDISLGELQKRSRVGIRPHPEALARRTVTNFLQELTERPLPQLLSRYSAPLRRFRELFPKILDLAVELQGQERKLISPIWPVRQISEEDVLVYVPMAPVEKPGALLFTVHIQEGQASLLDIARLADGQIPPATQSFGKPETWGNSFYLKPIDMKQFISEQIAKRVLFEFEPMTDKVKKEAERKRRKLEPATSADVSRALVETAAYVLGSYRFNDFEQLTVTDAMTGTRWAVSTKDLASYRRRNPPVLQPLP